MPTSTDKNIRESFYTAYDAIINCAILANRYVPTLENVLFKSEVKNVDLYKKRIAVVELLASIQPLIFFQYESEHVISMRNILNYYALPGSVIWQQIAVGMIFIRLDSTRINIFLMHIYIPRIP